MERYKWKAATSLLSTLTSAYCSLEDYSLTSQPINSYLVWPAGLDSVWVSPVSNSKSEPWCLVWPLYSRNENVFCAKRSSLDPSVLDSTPLVRLGIPCLFLINRFLTGIWHLGCLWWQKVINCDEAVRSCHFLFVSLIINSLISPISLFL